MATIAQKEMAIKAVDDMMDELVRTVSELVRIRSVNPNYPGVNTEEELGGETTANEYLAEIYREMGLGSARASWTC